MADTVRTILNPKERQTWYAVATVWIKKSDRGFIISGSHLFNVIGDRPLTDEEAKARALKHHLESGWNAVKYGPSSDYDVVTQSVDLSVVCFTVGRE